MHKKHGRAIAMWLRVFEFFVVYAIRLFTVPYIFVRSFKYTVSYLIFECTEGAGVGD